MSGISRLVGFLLLPIYTRIFSLEDYGIIDIFSIFTNLLVVTATLRLSTSISRYFSVQDRGFNKEELFTNIFFIVLFINATLLTIIFYFSPYIGSLIANQDNMGEYVKLSAVSAALMSISKIPMMALRRQRRIVAFSSLQILSTIIYASISLFLIFYHSFGIKAIFIGMVVSNSSILIGSIICVKKLFLIKINKKVISTSFKYSIPLMPGKYFMWFNGQLNRILLLYLLGLSSVGLFAIGSRISSMMQFFLNIFQKAWNPFSVEIINSKGSNFIFKKSLTYYFGITLIGGVLLSASSPTLLKYLTTENFYSAHTIVPWLVGSFIISGSSRILNIGTVIKEKMIYNSLAEVITFVVNVLLTYFLLKFYGFKFATIGMFFSQLLSKSYIWFVTQKISNIKFENNRIISMFIIYILFSTILTFYLDFSEDLFLINFRIFITLISILMIFKLSIDSLLINKLSMLVKEIIFLKRSKD